MTQASSIKKALELKPCPFCGGSELSIANLSHDGTQKFIFCDDCFARAGAGNGEEAAASYWNTRATFQPSGERREAIRALVHSTAMSLPPSDFGSHRAIEAMTDAFLASGLVQDEGLTEEQIIERERVRCAEICKRWIATFGGGDIKYTSAVDYAVDAINDIIDLITDGQELPPIRSARDGGEDR